MRIVFFLTIGVALPFFSLSQPSALVTASGSHFNSQVKVDWALGEISTESTINNTIQVETGVSAIHSVFLVTGDLKESGSSISVYPIPFKNEVFIDFQEGERPEFFFYDMSGRQLDLQFEVVKQQIRIDATTVAGGIYQLFLRTKKDTGYTTLKLIKQ